MRGQALDTKFTFDAEYLARMRARDKAALKHFYEYFALPIRNKIAHSVAWQDVEDLVQDVFAAVLSRIDAGEPREPLKLPGYVLHTCQNLIFHHYRKSRKEDVVVSEAIDFADVRESVEARLIRALSTEPVQHILQQLPVRYREAIHRRFVLEQDTPTAAREMGTTSQNFRLILCHALRRFRELWEKYFGDSPMGEAFYNPIAQ
jgi:RNA polymerase sigma factor (sigma-70 family)